VKSEACCRKKRIARKRGKRGKGHKLFVVRKKKGFRLRKFVAYEKEKLQKKEGGAQERRWRSLIYFSREERAGQRRGLSAQNDVMRIMKKQKKKKRDAHAAKEKAPFGWR